LQSHNISVQKTASYYTLRPEGEVKAVVFALHGYRQLARYFAPLFQPLVDQGALIIVPEALNRFYIEGYSGRVGASWMTKEDRETDIQDYVRYLNTLYEEVSAELSDLPIHLLGFSQGGPTACRWLAGSNIPFKSLMLYATVFPNDFDFTIHGDRLNALKCVMAFGDQDQFASEATIEEKMKWLKSKNFEFDVVRFIGGHDIQADVLSEIWKKVT